MKGKIAGLIGALLFIVVMVALGPTMFNGLNITGSPSFIGVALPVIVGGGLLMATWRLFT